MDRFKLIRLMSDRKYLAAMLTGILLMLPSIHAAAQVEIISEPGIERLMRNRINERILNGGKVPGYRVLVAYSNSRGAASIQTEDARRAFAGRFEVLQIYDEPNFKVYVGAFRYRWEAELALQEIQKKYRGARVVQDEIRLPAP
ncbi:MAG: hypothetical protein RL160_1767 [Bacteroidota bacterium]|jgi:hypothetical protein